MQEQDAGAVMGHFQATVRIWDVTEPDASKARRRVEEQLQKSGFTRWQLVYLADQDTARPTRRSGHFPRAEAEVRFAGAMMLLAAIVSWALWMVSLVAS